MGKISCAAIELRILSIIQLLSYQILKNHIGKLIQKEQNDSERSLCFV